MARITAFELVTLDGVMQAPGRPDEDTRGGFDQGGWATAYSGPQMSRIVGESMGRGSALLFGRRTYEDFYSVWPGRKGDRFSEILDASPKYVASRTLEEPLPWVNSTLLVGDAESTVAQLKAGSDGEIVILGSGELVRALTRAGLVDTFVLQIHPIVLGSGRRLFEDGLPTTRLTLTDSEAMETGVLVAVYEKA